MMSLANPLRWPSAFETVISVIGNPTSAPEPSKNGSPSSAHMLPISSGTHTSPAVTISLAMRAGSVCDPADAPGATHLLSRVIDACREAGYRQIVAVIGDSENVASIRVHEKLGFQHAGVLRGVGFKFDRWIDTVLMQLPL